MKQTANNKIFDGQQLQFTHASSTLNCDMNFSIFLPPQTESKNVPVLIWLSGLTCTDQNFVTKAGAQRYASKHGIAILCPDTSPRGDAVPDDLDGAWDFGLGAGFYLNATQPPWSEHYRMLDYVVNELPLLISDALPVDASRTGLSGHSMGGHGALTIALKHPENYRSVSAFSPIVSPMNCQWGIKAFSQYLGNDKAQWADYDACALVTKSTGANPEIRLPTLVDQGTADNFLEEQLKTDLLIDAASQANYPMTIRYQDGYDHSYFFIASFIEEHIAFHAQHLNS